MIPLRRDILPRDIAAFTKATKLAAFGEHRVRVGALATVGNKVIAGAFNTYRNDPKNVPLRNATYHAEQNCLSQVPDRLLNKVTLCVVRLNLAGEPLPSFPCSHCMELLKKSKQVNEIVYINKFKHLAKDKIVW